MTTATDLSYEQLIEKNTTTLAEEQIELNTAIDAHNINLTDDTARSVEFWSNMVSMTEETIKFYTERLESEREFEAWKTAQYAEIGVQYE